MDLFIRPRLAISLVIFNYIYKKFGLFKWLLFTSPKYHFVYLKRKCSTVSLACL